MMFSYYCAPIYLDLSLYFISLAKHSSNNVVDPSFRVSVVIPYQIPF